MIRDLARGDSPRTECEADVCVVGAGTAGIFLARQLRKQGLRVVMLEAGEEAARRPEEHDQLCDQHGVTYRGADSGRSFGLGGTSVLWGGQMLPLSRSDVEARPHAGFEAWPIGYDEIAAHLTEVRRQLGLPAARRPDETVIPASSAAIASRFPELRELGHDFELRVSQWIPFKKRNFAKGFAEAWTTDDGLTVWLNASVVGMNRSAGPANRRIDAVIAVSPNGRSLLVRASVVVICAGALESTRLLLSFDETSGGSITQPGGPIGRYFSDHLSVTAGRFACRNWRRYNSAVGPVFDRGVMHTPRLEVSERAQKRLGLASAFAHFVFTTHGETGFDVVRSYLRRRQGERTQYGVSVSRLRRVVSDVSAMALWRAAYRRLWIPRQAELLLQVDIEQVPNSESRVYLSDKRDALHRKRLVIDWKVAADDLRAVRNVTELAVAAWRNSPLGEVAELRPSMPEDLERIESVYDVYHPTGLLRMGHSASSSVVNSDLRLWATDNCYVSTTAVFPSAGSANPGLTHLALTLRLAEHIRRRLRPPEVVS